MFTPSLGFVLLFVANPQKSSLFYQEIFGTKPIEESPTFVMFALKNGVMLGLWSKIRWLIRICPVYVDQPNIAKK